MTDKQKLIDQKRFNKGGHIDVRSPAGISLHEGVVTKHPGDYVLYTDKDGTKRWCHPWQVVKS